VNQADTVADVIESAVGGDSGTADDGVDDHCNLPYVLGQEPLAGAEPGIACIDEPGVVTRILLYQRR